MLVSWWLGFGLLLDVGVPFVWVALWVTKCFIFYCCCVRLVRFVMGVLYMIIYLGSGGLELFHLF
jgi:hypothetical protein